MNTREQVTAAARHAAETTMPLDVRDVVQAGLDLASQYTDDSAEQEALVIAYTGAFNAALRSRVASEGAANILPDFDVQNN